jgi:uncharacterized protein YdhG (YjbR/CyaY superfamily)
MATPKAATIDEYIAGFPEDIQHRLEKVRETIRSATAGTGEKISYGIPCITLNEKYLLYFAGYKKHIGVYPVPGKGFEKEFAPYETSGKGTIQFPHDKPLPLKLISKIAKFRVTESRAKAKLTTKSKAAAKKK